MFIYVLVQCGLVSAEIEADYMWGLLHPCLLNGNGGYYLTTLSSAVHVLKQLRTTMENGEVREGQGYRELERNCIGLQEVVAYWTAGQQVA